MDGDEFDLCELTDRSTDKIFSKGGSIGANRAGSRGAISCELWKPGFAHCCHRPRRRAMPAVRRRVQRSDQRWQPGPSPGMTRCGARTSMAGIKPGHDAEREHSAHATCSCCVCCSKLTSTVVADVAVIAQRRDIRSRSTAAGAVGIDLHGRVGAGIQHPHEVGRRSSRRSEIGVEQGREIELVALGEAVIEDRVLVGCARRFRKREGVRAGAAGQLIDPEPAAQRIVSGAAAQDVGDGPSP